jgi:hypothetical protein
MCIMCLEILKGRMTLREGRKALTELVATTEEEELLEHYRELERADDKEMQEIIELN